MEPSASCCRCNKHDTPAVPESFAARLTAAAHSFSQTKESFSDATVSVTVATLRQTRRPTKTLQVCTSLGHAETHTWQQTSWCPGLTQIRRKCVCVCV